MNRLLKALHIVFVCLWVGAAASVVVLQCVRGWSADHRELSSLNVELAVLDASLIIPAAFGSVLTGALMCRTTACHFFRHRWVIAKWAGALCCMLLGTVLLGPWQIHLINMSGALDGTPTAGGHYDEVRLSFTAMSFLQVYLLVAMIAISALKPWGKALPSVEAERTAEVSNATRPDAARSLV